MSAPISESDLTFQWPAEKGFPFVLFLCVAGSLGAHVATFFLFQVVYPQRVTIPQPAPYVSLLTPSTPENVAYLRWIEAEDPALISRDNAVTPSAVVEVRYRPSFSAPRTAPLGAPIETSEESLFPPAVDRLQTTVAPSSLPVAPVTSNVSRTVLRFEGVLKGRALQEPPEVASVRIAESPVSPTVLLIGVTAEGEARFPVIQQSSGEPKLDDLAVAHLATVRFAPSQDPIVWGQVSYAWGADIYLESLPPMEPAPSVP